MTKNHSLLQKRKKECSGGTILIILQSMRVIPFLGVKNLMGEGEW